MPIPESKDVERVLDSHLNEINLKAGHREKLVNEIMNLLIDGRIDELKYVYMGDEYGGSHHLYTDASIEDGEISDRIIELNALKKEE